MQLAERLLRLRGLGQEKPGRERETAKADSIQRGREDEKYVHHRIETGHFCCAVS